LSAHFFLWRENELSTNELSTRLFEMAQDICPKSYFVSGASELDRIHWHGVETIAVTGGASTPDWIIAAVIDYLRLLKE